MHAKQLIIIALILLLLTSTVTGINLKSAYAPLRSGNHEPIYINGNDDFTLENGVTGGSGTENDPYIISDWVIEGDGITDIGIHITDTTAFFIIRNCSISGFHHSNEYFYGIRFDYVENGSIVDTILYNNHIGISLRYSKNIMILNCSCYDYPIMYAYGISGYYSKNITIINNECYNMYNGVDLSHCSDVHLKHSKFHDNTYFGFDSFAVETKTMRIHIENCSFYNNDYGGIRMFDQIFHQSYSIIRDCDIFNNGWLFEGDGISIQHLENNLVENCSIHDNVGGIFFDSSNNVIRNCSIYNHLDDTSLINTGITIGGWIQYLEFVWDNHIINCDIFNNEIGVSLLSTFRIKVEKNYIHNNSNIGIDIDRFSYGEIQFNNFENNGFENSTINTMCIASQQSFIDCRNNWWNDEEGACKYLALGWPYAIIKIPIRRTDGESVVFWKSIALTEPWLTDPVPDAGRQT